MGSAEVGQLLRCEADVRLMLGKCLFAKGDWNRARATISEVASLLRQLPPGGSGITGAADVERYREWVEFDNALRVEVEKAAAAAAAAAAAEKDAAEAEARKEEQQGAAKYARCGYVYPIEVEAEAVLGEHQDATGGDIDWEQRARAAQERVREKIEEESEHSSLSMGMVREAQRRMLARLINTACACLQIVGGYNRKLPNHVKRVILRQLCYLNGTLHACCVRAACRLYASCSV